MGQTNNKQTNKKPQTHKPEPGLEKVWDQITGQRNPDITLPSWTRPTRPT